MSYTMMIFSGILGVVIGLFLEVIFFSVDYSRTENVQFEDDEYYYCLLYTSIKEIMINFLRR